MAIAQLAKDAGMKYIIITSKHHDGFAMYHSKANDFNIVDATPFEARPDEGAGRRPAAKRGSVSDSTTPTTRTGPSRAAATARRRTPTGNPATFDDYFEKKCLPQVKEITSQYGPIEIVWFDTPGKMPKKYVEQLVEVVRKNQPNALVSGRAGHGLGDYQTLGDMEVPHHNVEGHVGERRHHQRFLGLRLVRRELEDAQGDPASPDRLRGRGGTYMLNIGPRGDGSVPERAARSLRELGRVDPTLSAGGLRHRRLALAACLAVGRCHGQGQQALPVGLRLAGLRRALPAGTEDGDPLGQTAAAATSPRPIEFMKMQGWTSSQLPPRAPEKLVSVIELELAGAPEADPAWGIDPTIGTEILAEFATVDGAKQEEKAVDGEIRRMEARGAACTDWKPDGKATWEVDVLSRATTASI